MDIEQRRKNESEMQSSWIPMTPLKPFPQRPEQICLNGQRLQPQEEISTLSEKGEQFHSQIPAVNNTEVDNWGTGNNVGICRENPFDSMAGISFTGLLALANAATVTSGNNTAQMANEGAAESRHLFSSGNSQIRSHQLGFSSATQSLRIHDTPLEMNSWNYCAPEGERKSDNYKACFIIDHTHSLEKQGGIDSHHRVWISTVQLMGWTATIVNC